MFCVPGSRVVLRCGGGGVVARVTHGFDERLEFKRLRGINLCGVGEQADGGRLDAGNGAQRSLDVMLAGSAAHAGDLEGLFTHAQGCSLIVTSTKDVRRIARCAQRLFDLRGVALGGHTRGADAHLISMRPGDGVDRLHDVAYAAAAVHVLDDKVQCGHGDSMLEVR
jgi:hypothetical protein